MMQARMRQASLVAVVVFASVVFFASTALAQSSNPHLGTWKLNLAKSRFDPGPAPSSDTRDFVVWDTDGVKHTVTTVRVDGTTSVTGYSAHYDGKDYKFTGPTADTVSLRRVDANTLETTLKFGGRVVQMSESVVSKDGQTRTVTVTGTDAQGRKINNVMFFDKQ